MKYDELVKELRARAWQGRFNIEAAEAITTLQNELEQCRKDAERYRFIHDVPYTEEIRTVMHYQQNAFMDAAIDKAMEETK